MFRLGVISKQDYTSKTDLIASNGPKIALAIEGGPDKIRELETSLGIVNENIKNKNPFDQSFVKTIG